MEISIFLAKVIGLYLIIVSLFMLLRYQVFTDLLREAIKQPGVMFLSAIETIMIGLLLVVGHNIWLWGWPVVITILAWIILIKGIFRLFFPAAAERSGNWWLDHPAYLYVSAVITLIVGIYLTYNGFSETLLG